MVIEYRHSGGIVAAVFQPFQAIEDDRDRSALPNIADNSAHMSLYIKRTYAGKVLMSFENINPILLDYRIRQDFPGDLVELGGGFFTIRGVVDSDIEILALPDIRNRRMPQPGESPADGLPLGVEDGRFQGDVDSRLHGKDHCKANKRPRMNVNGREFIAATLLSRFGAPG